MKSKLIMLMISMFIVLPEATAQPPGPPGGHVAIFQVYVDDPNGTLYDQTRQGESPSSHMRFNSLYSR